MFLFDEPASNLHSRAQSKLLDSLESIANGRNDVIYSTHSHHLINPLWLEHCYIITNGPAMDGEDFDASFVVDDIDISATRYRTFVGQNPERTHYFQPVLDRLLVGPSSLELMREGVFVEGKSDFYILNWYKKHFWPELNLDILPIGGATGASDLMALYLGVSKSFVLLLDGDKEGRDAKDRYLETLPLPEYRICLLTDFDSDKKEIEDYISAPVRDFIGKKYGVRKASKKHILRAFSEALNGVDDFPHDEEMIGNLKKLLEGLSSKFKQA